MARPIRRRRLLQGTLAAAAGATATSALRGQAPAAKTASTPGEPRPVRIGVIGTGGRGTGLLGGLLTMKGLDVPAVCDVRPAAAENARNMVLRAGRSACETYTAGEEDFKRLLDRSDLDGVIIATPWEWHTPMSVYAMKAGKYVGCEVPIALTVEECWQLVDTCEQTGVGCMMMENWSFRRDNLAVLNMIRQGLLGEIIHCHCAHSHNCMHWYFDGRGYPRWSGRHLIRRNCDLYPTHSLGPVLSWMDLNCGDRIDYVTSTASRCLGIRGQLLKKYGPNHPPLKEKYLQGDIVTTVARTVKGNTLVINNDMQTPRPYDNRWEIEGTNGLYNEQRNAVYIHGVSPKHEQWEPFAPYQEKYDHKWWKEMQASAGGHGGTDYLELDKFVQAVRAKGPTPISVYDSVVMSVIFPLSEQSITKGSAPVKCPDFTRGKWEKSKPYFAV
ncbi:MAG: Alpha-N-acetylgalactosaminidase [Planctomycetes bacterium ADurb.Bin126]|nr:MAG: Alpha-N-acetylgalactosaminidase [Planctomycetes bacterium ADurb.Bin126]HOD82443.1 Gfo/Idh/MocA family oxidoreductase [Phycisphaerae bacterium]HQL74763.1 Gfo/Idh/MocA family oxidoreductase [Phycisphaerae bacterium]